MDIVKEEDLEFSAFKCCGDEDLFPFKCSGCGHLMVFCYECDTLYPDLTDTSVHHRDVNGSDPQRSAFRCPKCDHEFEWKFMSNPSYLASTPEWRNAGHARLLKSNG